MTETLLQPWPWYVAGPIIGLIVPLLLLIGGKQFGISSNLRHMCAAALPTKLDFFRYDWKRSGLWNLTFLAGITLGGFLAAAFLGGTTGTIALAPDTAEALGSLGISDFSGLVPTEIISWSGLLSLPGVVMIVGGGFLVGFGARYAGGCTSGHAISGLANLQFPSLVAVVGFFVGGMLVTYVLLPMML